MEESIDSSTVLLLIWFGNQMNIIQHKELTVEQIESTKLLINRGRIKLMQSNLSFFGHILLQLKEKFNGHEYGVPTIGVSTDTIYYNMSYINSACKNTDDMIFVFLHEIMHIVLDHLDLSRIKMRDKMTWNKAGDHVINLDLYANGFTYSGDAHILKDKRFRGMNTEEVYDVLIKEDGEKGKGKGKGASADGSDGSGDSDGFWKDIIHTDDQEQLSKMREAVINAYNAHVLSHGSADGIPNSVRVAIEDIENQILPWQSLLSRYISETTRNDFSWNKLNRVFFPNFYIPGLYDESLAKIDFAIDVSGSINMDTFNKFINEIKNILLMNNITKIGIYQFDTRTLSYDIVSNLNELADIKFHGGGGTCIKDTLDKCKLTDSKALFIITDGYMDLNLSSPGKPTVWCVYNNPKFETPFGTTVLFDDYI